MAAKPKAFPKSLGACADLLFDLRQKRLDLDKLATAAKAEETKLVEHIINSMDKNSTGAAGKHHAVRVVTKQKPQLDNEKLDEFYKYVAKNKRWDMLQKRLSEQAIMDTIEAGKQVPGVKMFTAVTVSLTKI
jgi:hypothetical protein